MSWNLTLVFSVRMVSLFVSLRPTSQPQDGVDGKRLGLWVLVGLVLVTTTVLNLGDSVVVVRQVVLGVSKLISGLEDRMPQPLESHRMVQVVAPLRRWLLLKSLQVVRVYRRC